MEMIASGSAAIRSSQFIHGECAPGSPNRFSAPSSAISSGTQLPAAISGSGHSTAATRGWRPVDFARAAMADIRSFIESTRAFPRSSTPQARARRRMSWKMPERAWGSSAITTGRVENFLRKRALDVLQAHRADFALRLRDDVGGPEALQLILENVVDAEGAF